MGNGSTLRLTDAELTLLRAIMGFVEAGDISGGPLEGSKHQQTTANLRVFKSLQDKVSRV